MPCAIENTPNVLKTRAINCQAIKAWRMHMNLPRQAWESTGGILTEANSIVRMRSSYSSLRALSTGFLTNSTCLTAIVTGFLWDKDAEIAKMLRQCSTARDMSHGHGIMSSDRGIQAGWPLRISQGTPTPELWPLWSRTHLAESDMIRVVRGWFFFSDVSSGSRVSSNLSDKEKRPSLTSVTQSSV